MYNSCVNWKIPNTWKGARLRHMRKRQRELCTILRTIMYRNSQVNRRNLTMLVRLCSLLLLFRSDCRSDNQYYSPIIPVLNSSAFRMGAFRKFTNFHPKRKEFTACRKSTWECTDCRFPAKVLFGRTSKELMFAGDCRTQTARCWRQSSRDPERHRK